MWFLVRDLTKKLVDEEPHEMSLLHGLQSLVRSILLLDISCIQTYVDLRGVVHGSVCIYSQEIYLK